MRPLSLVAATAVAVIAVPAAASAGIHESVAGDPVGDASTIQTFGKPDITAATVRYDDRIGRFAASVRFDVAGGSGFDDHWVVARCTTVEGREVYVQVFMGTPGWGVGAAPFRADGLARTDPTFPVSRSVETAVVSGLHSYVSVVDTSLVGLRCADAYAESTYVGGAPNGLFRARLDGTTATPFAAVPDPAEPAIPSTPVPPRVLGPATPAPPAAPTTRPSCRILDAGARRGRAFRGRCAGTDRVVRVRYRRAGRQLVKRFTVVDGTVRAGMRGLGRGAWRVSVLDSHGKVGSGTVRVR